MANRFLEIGRVRPGHHFQADRYSFSERQRRRERSVLRREFARQAAWWREASFMERACRALWWSVLGALGATFGFCAIILLAGLVA